MGKHRQVQPLQVPALLKVWGVLLAVSAVAVLAILARPVVALLIYFTA